MVAELLSQHLVRASRSFFREATLGTTRNHGGKMEPHFSIRWVELQACHAAKLGPRPVTAFW